ncbi:PAS domain S-box protein [Aquihabitans daechungensis]|uniref:PAS domain S-box protein n=1 Tax=Aquihabitans daechungensis TaxID=1052257 RepID=UPI003B9F2B92
MHPDEDDQHLRWSRAMLDALPIPMAMGDLDGLVTDINQAALDLLGLGREDIIGKPALVFIHPDDRAASAASISGLAHGTARTLRNERRFLRPDGTTTWGDVSTTLVDREDGTPSHWMSTLIDITARKDAEAAQRRLASAVHASPDAIVATDLDGTITNWNPGAEHLYGYEASEVLGKDVRLLLTPELRGEIDAGLEALRLGGSIESYETIRQRRDGTTVPVSIRASPVRDSSGTIIGAASVARDLTDRERADARFKALLDAGPDAVLGVDESLRIVLANAAALELFAHDLDGLTGVELGEVLFDLGVPGSVGWALTPGSVPIGTAESITPDVIGHRRDGTQFSAEVTLSTIETEGDRLLLVGVRDGSERRQAAIVASSSDAILGSTLDGIITSWNAGAEQVYGYSAQEMIGRNLAALVPDDLYDDVQAVLDRIGRGEVIPPYESRRIHQDGRTLHVSISVSPVRDRVGTIVGASAAARDITATKKVQDALQASNALNAAIIEASLDCIVTMDDQGRIVEFSPSAERLFGYSRAEAVGQVMAELMIPPALRQAHTEGLAHYLATGEGPILGRRVQQTAMRRDGTEFPIELAISRVAVDGPAHFSAFLRDLTDQERLSAERRDLEHRLHQSQRLEGLGQLAGGIAHDFNNLLSVIMNYTAFVAERTQGDAELEDDVAEIQAAAERAAALTKQLLIFGRREEVRPQVVSLDAIIAGMQALLSRSIGEHIEMQVLSAGDLPAIQADPGQIEQVVLNLVVNARDAMPDGGQLTLSTSVTDLDEEFCTSHPGVAGRFVELAVSDSGHGMTQEVATRIFEPFFTTKAQGQGTGLGLATTYGIVSEAGGFIEVYSELDIGTVFRVRFPAESRPADAPPVVSRERPPGGTGQVVLLVEDEPALMKSTARMLRGNGYVVLEAPFGPDAVAIAQSTAIDLLLTDVVMPEMSGRQVADEVLQLQPDVGVLFMSGFSQGTAGSPVSAMPALDLVQKPFTERTLLERVRGALVASR